MSVRATVPYPTHMLGLASHTPIHTSMQQAYDRQTLSKTQMPNKNLEKRDKLPEEARRRSAVETARQTTTRGKIGSGENRQATASEGCTRWVRAIDG